MNAIHLTRNAAFHAKTKCIQLRYHFINTLLEGEHISLGKIHIIENPMNMLTKGMIQEKLKLFLALVGVYEG